MIKKQTVTNMLRKVILLSFILKYTDINYRVFNKRVKTYAIKNQKPLFH